MLTSHGTITRNAMAGAVTALVDAGAAAGKLKFRAGSTVLATLTLQKPGFATPSEGVASYNGLPLSTIAVATGTADNFQVTDSNDNVIFAGSVSALGGGGDCALDLAGAVVNVGQTVQVWAGGYRAPV